MLKTLSISLFALIALPSLAAQKFYESAPINYYESEAVDKIATYLRKHHPDVPTVYFANGGRCVCIFLLLYSVFLYMLAILEPQSNSEVLTCIYMYLVAFCMSRLTCNMMDYQLTGGYP